MPAHTSKASPPLLDSRHVFYFLLAFRICNALLVQTFFQPDEYFQSLEPAWRTAFGDESGAWITWVRRHFEQFPSGKKRVAGGEWKQNLRSSLHPLFFAAVYRVAALGAEVLGLNPTARSEVLLAAPKVVQALFAAASDFYTWRLAQRAYGSASQASYGALFLTVCSPWQWFCSTRTLSNSAETTLTALALYLWPFESPLKTNGEVNRAVHNQMRSAFGFAVLATVLRPTNIIIWLVVALYTATMASNLKLMGIIKALLVESSAASISGSVVLALSVISDRVFYDTWTFPPLRFVHFNVVQSLAVFYGRNRPDYYITEGLPLLLTTALPFAAIGWFQAMTGKAYTNNPKDKPNPPSSIPRPLALSVVLFIAFMSLIAHKEVRFIYPLLPILHVVGSHPFSAFFFAPPLPRSRTTRLGKKLLLAVFVLTNASFAFYISRVHQRGVLDVTHFLRSEHEQRLHLNLASGVSHNDMSGSGTRAGNTSVLFLMPCHSTPWRSHLVHDGIEARALTCEPPIDVPVAGRGVYLDEADLFYADPPRWMRENMEATGRIAAAGEVGGSEEGDSEGKNGGSAGAWPEYLVFFEQLEPTMREFLKGTRYGVCWRGFNSHWHDDWRRKGDVVVWCLA